MRITTKDLIQTGIFTAVYAVVYMIFNMTGAIAPVLQVILGPVSIVINGITFMLFLSRVRTPFGPLLMVGLLSVLLVVMGHHFVTLITGLFAGAMASWLAAIWPPEKTAKSVWAYAFFSLWPIPAAAVHARFHDCGHHLADGSRMGGGVQSADVNTHARAVLGSVFRCRSAGRAAGSQGAERNLQEGRHCLRPASTPGCCFPAAS